MKHAKQLVSFNPAIFPKEQLRKFFFLFSGEKGFDSLLCFVIATTHGNLEEGKVIIKNKYGLFLAC